MKKIIKPKKLSLDKTTVQLLCANDLRDIVGGTNITVGCSNNTCEVCRLA